MTKRRSKKNRHLPFPRKTAAVIAGLLLLFILYCNWHVHQPAGRRAGIEEYFPAFLVETINETGNATAEYTDGLGITGRDVSIPLPEPYSFASGDTPLLGAAPRPNPGNAVPPPEELAILQKAGFCVAYSPADKHPYWVAYMVSPVRSLSSPPRPSRFTSDRAVKSPGHDAYSRSGYDRGHMAPNFAIATRYGREAQKQTFLTSNIAPQRPALNQGPWRDVEHRIARIYGQRYPVWVIIGALPPSTPEDRLASGVAIPAGFYHIMVSKPKDRLRVCALLFPQDAPRGAHPRAYLTSVREIEALTGLDFFADLSQDEQDELELSPASRLWPAGFGGSWETFKDRTEVRALRDKPPFEF